MGFAKAFDKVPHRRLLYKLKYYGIQENTLLWIQAFLSDRTQTVVVNGISGWFFLEETVSLVHLFGWKAIRQSASHRAAESRSCWSLRQSSCVLISL
jgi:hypothetical protein